MALSGVPGGLGCACSDAAAKNAGAPWGMSGLRGLRGLGSVTVIAQGVGLDNVTGQTVAVSPSLAIGADATPGNVQDTSSGPSVQDVLGVPGQITGAFGLTPMQATQLGLTLAGRGPKPVAPMAAPAAGVSGTTLALVGLGLLGVGGIALGMKSRKTA